MSDTVLYRIGIGEIGRVRNSWRGGMYVWTDIARRYFKLECFPMFDKDLQKKIWNAYEYVQMLTHEIIVLHTTMDYAVIKGCDVNLVAAAFEQYHKEHRNSSFSEQAGILILSDLPYDSLVGWNQTTVSAFWGIKDYDENTGEAIWYNDDKQFDAYASALKNTREK